MKRNVMTLTGLGLALSWPAWAETALVAKHIGGEKVPLDAGAAVWKGAPAVTVDLLAQNFATPFNAVPAVKRLRVRSLHTGAEIGFLLEWQDSARDDMPRSGKYSDAVAIEFPLDQRNPTSPMMGAAGPGGRVNILQWRADWQRDVEKGETTPRDLYPNMVNDAETRDVYKGTDPAVYSAGRVIGNIVSQTPNRRWPVVDLMAEGYGSLTTKQVQAASGRGVWSNGWWHVVISRPMSNPVDANATRLMAGSQASIAFAVWNGGAGERGPRKGWAPWVPLTIAK